MTISIDKKSEFKLEKGYNISMSEQDMRYCLKPAALLNFLQDAASCNIDNSPYSNQAFNGEGIGWFLVRYRIEFDNYPQNLNTICVRTENRGLQKLTAYRDFEAYDSENKRILRATTSWLVVNLEDKSLVNIEQKFPNIIKFEKREDDLLLRKLKSPDESDNEKIFHVRYEDLDMNGHVNNTVYISWAMEALSYDFLCKHKIKTIDIYYKHEVRYGDDILSCVKFNIENNITEHVIKNAKTGAEVCLIKIEHEKI